MVKLFSNKILNTFLHNSHGTISIENEDWSFANIVPERVISLKRSMDKSTLGSGSSSVPFKKPVALRRVYGGRLLHGSGG